MTGPLHLVVFLFLVAATARGLVLLLAHPHALALARYLLPKLPGLLLP